MSGRSPRISWSHWLKGTTWQEGTKGKERSSRSHGTTGMIWKIENDGSCTTERRKGRQGRDLAKTVCRELLEDLEKRVRLVQKGREEKERYERIQAKKHAGTNVTESPGKSISAPRVMMSPADRTRDEGHNMSFYCRAGGNPIPSVEWRFMGRKRLSGANYLIREGDLVVRNLN